MAKGRRPKPDRLAADDVLAGRVVATPAELLGLIHDLNPTGRELDAAETSRRYVLKSRLQSLLVRRHRDDLIVEVDAAREGVVGLRHRYLAVDGCHAVITSLDDDARSWVQLQVDLGPPEPAPAAAPVRPPAAARVADLDETEAQLARGREALEAYDYDEARAAFDAALDASAGAAGPALALLELLVDHLGQGDEALAVEARLSREALARPEARALLAVAAARAGDREATRRHAAGAPAARAAEALVTLATQLLAADDADEADRLLADARQRDPAHPELVTLAAAVAAARERARRPDEERAAALHAAGRAAEAEAAARAILERWPDSAVARRILRELEAARRRTEAAELLARAEEALAAGKPAAAAELAARAGALGADAGAVADRAAAALAAQEQRRRDDRVLEVAGLLGDPAAGERALRDYLALDDDGRAQVRFLAARAALGWLEELGAPAGGARGRAALDAALALERAAAAADPHAVLSLLGPHERALDALPFARELLAGARGRLDHERRAAAESGLAAARAAFDAGDLDGARRRLDALPAAARAAARDLDAALRRADDLRRRAARVEELAAAGALLEARDEAAALAAADHGFDGRRDELAAAVRRAWRVEVLDDADGGDLATHPDLGTQRTMTHVDVALTEGGDTLVLATVESPWVFIRRIEVATGRVRRLIRLCAPAPFEFPHVHCDGSSVWVVAHQHALRIDWTSGDVLRWRSVRALLPEDRQLRDATVVPGGRFVWLSSALKKNELDSEIVVVEAEGWRPYRTLAEELSASPIPGPGTPRLLCVDVDGGGRLYDERGARVPDVGFSPAWDVESAAIQADGDGLAVIVADEDENGDKNSLGIVALRPGRTPGAPAWLERPNPKLIHSLATSTEASMSFVIYRQLERGVQLAALATDGDGFVERWRVPVAATSWLATDAAARKVVAVVPTYDGLSVAPLGAAPPALPPGREEIWHLHLPELAGFRSCRTESEGELGAIASLERELRRTPAAQLAAFAENMADSVADARVRLIQVKALRLVGERDQAETILRQALERRPRAAELRLERAKQAAAELRWDEVRTLLAGIKPKRLGQAEATHAAHLLGAAHLWLGDVAAARRVWQEALPIALPECRLDECLALTEPPADPEEWLAPDRPVAFRIAGAILAADRALARSDGEAARRILDRPIVWTANELQSAARLAEAFLVDPPGDPRGRFRAALALAWFAALHDLPAFRHREELVLPGSWWDRARLADLARRARAWLDA